MENQGKRETAFRKGFYPEMLVLPFCLLYFELVFNISSVSGTLPAWYADICLLALGAGFLIELILCLIPGVKVRRGIRIALLFLAAIPFGVEYFIFRQFHVFYDINTVFNGAGGVVKHFLPAVMEMVLSFRGILIIVLLLLPGILYSVFCRKFASESGVNFRRMLVPLAAFAVCLGAALILIFTSPALKGTCTDEYNFEAAVKSVGLLPSVGMDAVRTPAGAEGADLAFDYSAAAATPAVTPEATQPVPTAEPSEDIPEATEEPEPTPEPVIEYGKNELDIDFTALAERTSGTISSLAEYCDTLTPSSKNAYTGLFKGKNVIFITAEAFSAEAIDPELTPTLYRLATKGINFTDYYIPATAGTTGGEFENLIGMLPVAGGSSMSYATSNYLQTLASYLDQEGYYGKAFHNNDYTYYKRNKTHNNLGYSDGFMGYGNGMEDYVTNQWPESDLEMMEGTLPLYIDQEPFNVYYMTVSGHSNYSVYANAMSKKNYDKVEDLDYSDPVKAYLACQIELENAVSFLVQSLEEKGIADDTVIVIGADHFPYGLTEGSGSISRKYLSELYGYDIKTNLEMYHNRAIIWSGCLEDEDPIIVSSPTSSIDLLPTLLNLFGCDFDSRLFPGRDVLSDAPALAFTLSYDWKTDLGTYTASTRTFTPADESAEIPEDYVQQMSSIVKNKITYMNGALYNNFYAYVFGEK